MRGRFGVRGQENRDCYKSIAIDEMLERNADCMIKGKRSEKKRSEKAEYESSISSWTGKRIVIYISTRR